MRSTTNVTKQPTSIVDGGGVGFFHPTDGDTDDEHRGTRIKKQRRKFQCACCDEFDIEFAAGTTCHGLNLVCNTHWNWYRRCFWMVRIGRFQSGTK